jgi:hypothetical protein
MVAMACTGKVYSGCSLERRVVTMVVWARARAERRVPTWKAVFVDADAGGMVVVVDVEGEEVEVVGWVSETEAMMGYCRDVMAWDLGSG